MNADVAAGRDLDTQQVVEFIAHEAALADHHDYDEWLALWEEDGRYDVPTSASLDDPLAPAIIRDDVPALRDRVARLQTGLVHSQSPPSKLARVVGTPRLSQPGLNGRGEWGVEASFVLLESRPDRLVQWGGHVTYVLRERQTGGFGLVLKRVLLVNRDEHLPPLTFLI